MKKEIREKRNELLKESIKLRGVALDFDGEKSNGLRKKQDEIYKKWKFYTNMIKEFEKNE